MVAVFNFGGQYAHLIARRVRELRVRSELISPNIGISDLKKLNPQAIIFSGSPHSAYDKKSPRPDIKIYDIDVPILGICYGHQLFAYQLKGKVFPSAKKQFGKVNLKTTKSDLFKGLKPIEKVWFSHGDKVEIAPPGFKTIASTTSAKIAAMENSKKRLYSVQFHPEVTHTPKGMQVLSNFLFDIAKVQKDWDLAEVKAEIVEQIKSTIKSDKVIMAISGGVDSLVAATLIKESSAKNLHLVFINTGFIRKGEVEEVKHMVKTVGFSNFRIADKSAVFLKALNGITDPEEKRKIIAKLYFKVFEDVAKSIKGAKFLGQGTIYPDRVESASTSKHADKIKSHHNLTLPSGLKLKIIEPLAELYKDEVRKIGKLLGLPDQFLMRHPFPGPGLAIRIVGEVTQERLDILKEVDDIFTSELKSSNIYKEVSQALAALLPVKSVGVMGDARTYSYIVSLRSVNTNDFMTADWSKLPYEFLERVSSRIVNEVKGVNRVVYDITQKPPATIEYE